MYIALFFSSFGVRIFAQYFFVVVRNETLSKIYLPELIKRRSTVHEKNMSHENASSFNQL